MRRAVRYCVLAAAAILLVACSFTRLAYMNAALAYSNATPVLAWMVGDYVELTDVQKGWVRERLARVMSWHRAQELPEYRRFFVATLARAEDGISVDEARAAYLDLRAYYHRLVERMLPDIADFLGQLDADQIIQLERKFAEDNRKMVRDSVSDTPEERHERRVKRYLDHLEEFTGRLSEAQRELVATRVATMAELVEERLGDRRYRQAETLALLHAKASKEEMIAGLRRLLIEPESWRRPEYQKKLGARDEQIFEMIAALSLTLSPEQRSHLQGRVRGFMRDISELTVSN